MTFKTLVHIHDLMRADLSAKQATLDSIKQKSRAWEDEHAEQSMYWIRDNNPYREAEELAVEQERESRWALDEFEENDWN